MNEENDPKDLAADTNGEPKPVTNSPQAKAGADWQMPAPVFRVSEGMIIGKVDSGEVETTPAVDNPQDTPPDTDHLPSSDELDATDPVPAKRSGGRGILKVVFILIVLFVTILLITAAAFVYFRFFYQGGSVFD